MLRARGFRTAAVLGGVSVLCGSAAVATAAVSPVATVNLGLSAFVENAAGTIIYAAAPAANEVVAINPTTLKVVGTLATGTDPVALSLSLDGSKLYVSNNGNTSIGVINTGTFAAGTPIPVGSTPLAVVPGTNNRLWVLVGSQNSFTTVEQVNATTGASTGANLPGTLIYGGNMYGSPDGKTLYYGDYGTSGSYLARYNISGTSGSAVWSIDPGGNGEDLELSRDGSKVALICGGGNNNVNNGYPYSDAVYNTADGSIAGGYFVGAYPESFAFSPDTLVGYAGEDFNNPDVQSFSLSSVNSSGLYTGLTSFEASADPSSLFVDSTGRYLFANVGSSTAIYSTGRVAVPEPSTLALLPAAAVAVVGRRRRRPGSRPGRA